MPWFVASSTAERAAPKSRDASASLKSSNAVGIQSRSRGKHTARAGLGAPREHKGEEYYIGQENQILARIKKQVDVEGILAETEVSKEEVKEIQKTIENE